MSLWKDEEKETFLKLCQRAELLGFDNLMEMLSKVRTNALYPPYNVQKVDQHSICIEIALAGFESQNISITLEGMELTIIGQKPEELEKKEYYYKGIASRSFIKKFLLAEGMQVQRASMKNGILRIMLYRPQPVPQTISIEIEEL